MIIAHPDDELFFGWKLFNEDKWLIICMTNKNNKKRSNDFHKVCKLLKQDCIIFNYKDKWNNLGWNYQTQKDIKDVLISVLSKYQIDKIVTHNPDGEYGHYHHKIISKLVTQIVMEKLNPDLLYYFTFNINCYQSLTDTFIECLNIYFDNPTNILSVKGHMKLAEISHIIYCNKYNEHNEYNKEYDLSNYYPDNFLKSILITYDKYLNYIIK